MYFDYLIWQSCEMHCAPTRSTKVILHMFPKLKEFRDNFSGITGDCMTFYQRTNYQICLLSVKC
jgi:hypothetical protein